MFFSPPSFVEGKHMSDFSQEELNLICLYDPGSLSGLLYELRAMEKVLMPDEKELRALTQGVIHKLEIMTRKEYEQLNTLLIPPFGAFHFDDVADDAMSILCETEE